MHIWLMHGSLFVTGVPFWLQFIPSSPVRIRMQPGAQVAALAGTNVVMWLLAMCLGGHCPLPQALADSRSER